MRATQMAAAASSDCEPAHLAASVTAVAVGDEQSTPLLPLPAEHEPTSMPTPSSELHQTQPSLLAHAPQSLIFLHSASMSTQLADAVTTVALHTVLVEHVRVVSHQLHFSSVQSLQLSDAEH